MNVPVPVRVSGERRCSLFLLSSILLYNPTGHFLARKVVIILLDKLGKAENLCRGKRMFESTTSL